MQHVHCRLGAQAAPSTIQHLLASRLSGPGKVPRAATLCQHCKCITIQSASTLAHLLISGSAFKSEMHACMYMPYLQALPRQPTTPGMVLRTVVKVKPKAPTKATEETHGPLEHKQTHTRQNNNSTSMRATKPNRQQAVSPLQQPIWVSCVHTPQQPELPRLAVLASKPPLHLKQAYQSIRNSPYWTKYVPATRGHGSASQAWAGTAVKPAHGRLMLQYSPAPARCHCCTLPLPC